MTQAYPLHWPENRPRSTHRERSRFDTTQNIAQSALLDELRRLGATDVILSTNIELRTDGQPFANRRTPADPGVAVYFDYDGEPVCFACDRWDRVGDNIQAIRKTVEALRGIARWGTGDMMAAAFRGFQALPSPSSATTRPWQDVLGIPVGEPYTLDDAETYYRERAKFAHPDNGGSHEKMAELNAAIDQAREFFA